MHIYLFKGPMDKYLIKNNGISDLLYYAATSEPRIFPAQLLHGTEYRVKKCNYLQEAGWNAPVRKTNPGATVVAQDPNFSWTRQG
jgi:hypothetical protein